MTQEKGAGQKSTCGKKKNENSKSDQGKQRRQIDEKHWREKICAKTWEKQPRRENSTETKMTQEKQIRDSKIHMTEEKGRNPKTHNKRKRRIKDKTEKMTQ